MFRASLLTLLWLFVELSQQLSFDIVVGGHNKLEFYLNGTLTHTEIITSAHEIHSVTYDPVQYRVLFADYNTTNLLIYSFDISTNKTQHLLTRKNAGHYLRVVYDPLTQVLYWSAGREIYSYSLNPAILNKEVDGKLLITLDHYCHDLAVDSCGGYIYWITRKKIERAWLDGSDREVLVNYTVYDRLSLAIDQQTQKMYWTERNSNSDNHLSIENADLNGKRRTTLYIVRNANYVNSLAVSKDFFYWHDYKQGGLWQLPKNQKHLQAIKLYSMSQTACGACHQIAVNYTLQEQTDGIKSCNGLRCLISKSASPVSICQYYCFQGECSVSAEGRPTCSCKAGYSGERCEVNACHDYCLHGGVCSLNEENKRVCQCTSGYEGDRCGVPICKDYCFQGNCSVAAEGQPMCSCEPGYSGKRCEVSACKNRCSNNGVCSLNEDGEPVCECTSGYEGDKCDVSICKDYCFQGNCSVAAEGQPKCSCEPGYSGKRCEVSACKNRCSNNGVCSLNEDGEPVCECTSGYEGDRCDVSICKDYCFQGNCSVAAEGQPKCSCEPGYSGKRCEVSACKSRCSNNGVCSLNEDGEPVCECTSGYEGERCDVSICKDYCLQGNCSLDAIGLPKCSCLIGYSGERCEINACHEYCLNDGVCSLNEEDEPSCQCTTDYDGVRCEVSAYKDNSCDAGSSGEGKVSACHQFCLNDGVCSLDEASEPVCQCTADYEGDRCEVPHS
ncbi:hypothetical protein PYW07_011390 [Mythimna separata]|uniref:EGF-like domain-containing protein n=1 Tax=Mythimna separata TaxID=271217 RepID=A0AAD8DLF8_MYTSE|nr:hypothetical protein PYW07_011390 [Mythimna separata]